MYKLIFKRIIDVAVAVSIFIILSPLFFVTFCALLIVNQGKPFFYQKRPGYKAGIFTIIKFKTMNDRKDKNGNLLPDEKRLTKVGQIVRSTSLDEIPQLLNVIKGDMSLIGPRPLLVEYLPLYSESQSRRHDLKPGITGWAQVNGRNAISWKQKFEYDVWYVDNCAFLIDLKVIFVTIKKVLGAKDISSSTSVTMEKFTGNESS
ncbi:sugar transferase [Flammeovirga pectinis]|uniref:Sugar transferase n=1 Tax=Flammeovirga pectinis TaxID=2494373 RepID=A0A3S9P5X0_9BACT|nr:sugar transferase [Flammeovirga pectinis]AZQ63563.1 sugar transferase [Flammeovirga pectinis]